MDRRRFLSLSALTSAAVHPAGRLLAEQSAIPVALSLGKPTGNRIAASFLGLSYESAQLSDPTFFSGDNAQLISLVRGLGPRGVLRIGGNTSEYCFWKQDPQAQGTAADPIADALGPDKGKKAPPRRVITEEAIHQLRAFLDATGWSLIYGLNLGQGTPQAAAEEAAFVSAVMGERLVAFQMANEPDLFYKNGLRPASYNSAQFIEEWRTFFKAVRARVPNAPFAGPDTAFNNDWLVPFARAFRHDLAFVSSHYYAEGPPSNPAMDIPRLLHPDAKLDREFAGLEQVTHETGLPFRLAETNSCYGGGKQGVSDTFASALWVADTMFRVAAAGGIGVNLHGGGYGWYTPIAGTRAKGFVARPVYYGMKLFAQAAPGDLLEVHVAGAPTALRVYATRNSSGHVCVAALNLSLMQDVDLTLDRSLASMRVVRLQAPAIAATAGVTLGGAPISDTGAWSAARQETAGSRLRLPAASGALLLSS